MTDRTDDPPVADGPTRDIHLPPLPGRPPPVLPEAWAGLRGAVDAPTAAVPGPLAPPPAPTPETLDQGDAEARRAAGRRTDEIVRSPGPARERTLAFSAPEMRHRPIEPVRVGATPRRWPWVLLALVPVLVILGSAVAWLLLVRGA